ncbi:hypothetical protein [uncultured Peptoniphilus sp.]|uniref:hypothetical protein n=1 Tax=uncultured Peptoniphilus sp. TaxID=254354 RepID=UPI0025E9B3CC|nr:hypothetical protein [uncultured Peptoniphilus sp.]
MNREYILIGIAKGRTTAEANNIILTDKEKQRVNRYREKVEKSKKEGKNIVFYAPEDD